MSKTTKHDLTENALAHFTGTETWWKHGLVPGITFTDGVKYVADHGGAYWLIDEIATNQLNKKIRAEGFQTWTLKREVGKRCNRCNRLMKGTTAYDGACSCGGLIEAIRFPEFPKDYLDSAELTMDDGDGNIKFVKRIEYTDFPLREIKIWFTDNVILLPSEY